MRQVRTLAIIVVLCTGCTWDNAIPDGFYQGYPTDIGEIVIGKCAVSGCHNSASYIAAGGLNLSSWDKLFEGTLDNSAVIPYRSDQSFLTFFINSYTDLGPILTPTMPYNGSVLSKEEVLTVIDWVNSGAPNDEGFVKFSDDTQRKKWYVTNQGCDLVAVFDQQTSLAMRYIDVGAYASIESPHMVEVSPDGNIWAVCFYIGDVLQVYNTSDDALKGNVVIGSGSWNTLAISPNSKYAFVVNLAADGSVAVVNLETMTLEETYQGFGLLEFPHGSAMDSSGNTLYITSQFGNYINKIDVTNINAPVFEKIVVATGETANGTSLYDPHEICFSPDNANYFVTCQKSNEVRVFDPANDSLIAVIPVGKFPQEITFSSVYDYAYVSCMEDDITFPGTIGSVSVLNYKTFTHVKSIYTGYQPHGIAADDNKMQVYVINRNANLSGPAPHHTTECGGRNGYVTIIDMNTLELVDGYKAELSVDPYFVSIRH
ncbi:MAG TPA: YncE family protein [Flavobacteriales bacterium]|nr:YncE family protein [Flavobacteriales bacterium]